MPARFTSSVTALPGTTSAGSLVSGPLARTATTATAAAANASLQVGKKLIPGTGAEAEAAKLPTAARVLLAASA